MLFPTLIILQAAEKQKSPPAMEGFLSGWQDSNLRPPGPKPGAMTGLRYIPKKTAPDFIGGSL